MKKIEEKFLSRIRIISVLIFIIFGREIILKLQTFKERRPDSENHELVGYNMVED